MYVGRTRAKLRPLSPSTHRICYLSTQQQMEPAYPVQLIAECTGSDSKMRANSTGRAFSFNTMKPKVSLVFVSAIISTRNLSPIGSSPGARGSLHSKPPSDRTRDPIRAIGWRAPVIITTTACTRPPTSVCPPVSRSDGKTLLICTPSVTPKGKQMSFGRLVACLLEERNQCRSGNNHHRSAIM